MTEYRKALLEYFKSIEEKVSALRNKVTWQTADTIIHIEFLLLFAISMFLFYKYWFIVYVIFGAAFLAYSLLADEREPSEGMTEKEYEEMQKFHNGEYPQVPKVNK